MNPTLNRDDISNLWDDLTGLFGHKFTTGFGEETDASGRWLSTLQGLTPLDIARGIKRLETSGRDWPPSAPEFRRLCAPNAESLGLPSESAAYIKFCCVSNTADRIKWEGVHPAIYYAYRQLDSYRLKNLAGTNHRNMFIGAYREAVTQAANGFEFPPVPLAIEHKPEPKAEPKATDEQGLLAKIRQLWNI